jgi:hypothetical protein
MWTATSKTNLGTVEPPRPYYTKERADSRRSESDSSRSLRITIRVSISPRSRSMPSSATRPFTVGHKRVCEDGSATLLSTAETRRLAECNLKLKPHEADCPNTEA